MAKQRVVKNVRIDSALLKKEIKKKYGTKAEFCRTLGISISCLNNSLRSGVVPQINITAICSLLGKPVDYFKLEEHPVKEEVTAEPVKEDDTFNASLLLELKKIEAVLISINRKLDGKPTGMVIEKLGGNEI